MKRHAVVGNTRHVVEVNDDGKMLSLEGDNLDSAGSIRILRIGEEAPQGTVDCENCFPPKFTDTGDATEADAG